jgi:hypothetical protein
MELYLVCQSKSLESLLMGLMEQLEPRSIVALLMFLPIVFTVVRSTYEALRHHGRHLALEEPAASESRQIRSSLRLGVSLRGSASSGAPHSQRLGRIGNGWSTKITSDE